MMNRKIKITFILPSLAAGGAERILSFVAQHLDSNKFKPTLLIIGYEKDTIYNLQNLDIIYLNKSRVLKGTFSLFKYFNSVKPDIVVSSIVHLNTLIALISICFPKIKFVAREANVLSVLEKHNPLKKSIFPKFLISYAYKLVDLLICQSKDMQQDMIANYGVSIDKTVLINNPITNVFQHKKAARSNPNILTLITVARLSKEKGHHRIIEVLSKLKFPFKYIMIGDGNEKDTILNLIEKKELTEKVEYIKFTNEVEKYLLKSDIFIQGSYSEGFPNALIESCVVGTPIVAFNAPGGLDEIIEIGKNGYIHNTIEDIVDCLNSLNTNFTFNPKIVSEVVKKRFDKNRIILKYEALFLELMSPNER